jgi:folate-binding protein YgfZ
MALSYDRRIVAVSGADARGFLQGLLTQDVTRVSAGSLLFTAMLSPQGKLLFDGFLWAEGDAICWDVAAEQAETLEATLRRYKLRAAVTLELREAGLALFNTEDAPAGALVDPRHPAMPCRVYGASGGMSADAYHRARFACGIPEASYDSAGNDVAMDLGYDALGAISFTKGCYVGQEVTARMHYKQIARKQVMRVVSEVPLVVAEDAKLMAGDLAVGELRSYMGSVALAVVKLEPWEQALQEGHEIRLGMQPVRLIVPEWGESRIAQFRQGKLAGNAQI